MIIFGWNGWQNLHSRSSGNEFLKFSPSTFLQVVWTIILVRWPWRLVISFINDQMWNDSKFIANLIVKWEWHFHRNSRRLIRWPLTALTIWNIYPQFNLWAQLANWFKSWIIVLSWTEFTIFSSCTFVKKKKYIESVAFFWQYLGSKNFHKSTIVYFYEATSTFSGLLFLNDGISESYPSWGRLTSWLTIQKCLVDQHAILLGLTLLLGNRFLSINPIIKDGKQTHD